MQMNLIIGRNLEMASSEPVSGKSDAPAGGAGAGLPGRAVDPDGDLY
jgi:hypothetical protein